MNLYRIEFNAERQRAVASSYVEAESIAKAVAIWTDRQNRNGALEIEACTLISSGGVMRDERDEISAPASSPTAAKPGHAVGCVEGACAPACRAPRNGGEF